MAKKTKVVETQPPEAPAELAVERKLEDFAEDLGRLLGNTQVKASAWMDQRKALLERLTQVRDAAASYIDQLGGNAVPSARRGRRRKVDAEVAPAPLSKMQRRKKRTMSPEAREKIAAAQRARWAKQKKAAKG